MAKFSAPAGAARLRRTRASQRHRPIAADQQRVDVELGDLRHVDQQLRHPDQHPVQRRLIGRRRVAMRAQRRADAPLRCTSARASGTFSGGSASAARPPPRSAAALAEQDHRAEQRRRCGADDQLVGMRRADHRLHAEAVDARLGQRALQTGEHAPRRVAHLHGAAQVQAHAADVGACARCRARRSSAPPGSPAFSAALAAA